MAPETDKLLGLENCVQLVVTHNDTAAVYGSGALEVFATPAMIALMEKTCLESLAPNLGVGNTSVGTKVNISHLKASAVGATVTCRSKVIETDRRRVVFAVSCHEGDSLVGEGTHERFIVDSEKFMGKL